MEGNEGWGRGGRDADEKSRVAEGDEASIINIWRRRKKRTDRDGHGRGLDSFCVQLCVKRVCT